MVQHAKRCCWIKFKKLPSFSNSSWRSFVIIGGCKTLLSSFKWFYLKMESIGIIWSLGKHLTRTYNDIWSNGTWKIHHLWWKWLSEPFLCYSRIISTAAIRLDFMVSIWEAKSREIFEWMRNKCVSEMFRVLVCFWVAKFHWILVELWNYCPYSWYP
jgi:hypothetical protein